MIDFSEIKKLTIDGTELKQLFINGIQVWESGYKNLIEIATTDPGGTEIYNGTGYRDGYRWSSSGREETIDLGGRLSGWMPFTSGATYRVKNFNCRAGYCPGIYFALWYEDGATVCQSFSITDEGYNKEADIYTAIVNDSKAKYFRISGYKGDNVPIVTMNEEISE